ncbi:hypothetical protein [Streptomyces sp. NRRL B-1347]|uniref:hypothetical protein n=1 Tax=Streptomyces sp. NRRL B-1347 TaxID=1476877 RepID=UPI0007C5ACCE|nr:hypothetical protein [Streptomyces sp. NRRL B-1347]
MSVTVPGGATVRLHRLTMVAEDDGVMVGRPDTGSYAVFPAEGAQVLRLLGAGETVADAAAWYARTCGESLDMEDFLAAVDDLGFLRAAGDAPDAEESAPAPVRWQRLGRWTFSRPARACYGVLVTAALTAMVRDPALRPSYHQLMFTSHISLIAVTLFGAAIPCILVHEGFHALAGRRLGLPSTLGIGRRFYYLVAETRMDTLLSVERRRRYLPFLAGMLADVLLVSALTLASAGLSRTSAPGWLPALCLAVSFTCVLRLIWQFLFYLETDLYYVATTALRCTDLQNATRFHLRALVRRRLRRPPPRADGEWSEHDRAMARRYAPVLVSGYAFSLASLAWAAVPTALTFWSTAIDRFTRAGTPAADRFDAAFFVALTTFELGLLLYVTVRDRRAKSRTATAARRGASA